MSGTGRPGRFATQDVLPDGAADDVDFQRAVQRLEEQQPSRAGWLDPRGAFDKGDQAYLREVEERRRHVEEAQAARETNEFLSARAKAEREEEEKRIRAGGGILSAGLASKKPGIDAEQRGKKKRLLPVVVVKPVSKGEERGATKRPRSEPAQEGEAQPPGGEEKQPAGADEQREGGVHEEERHEESEDQGLGGLLGGYGSDGSDASGDGAPDEGQKAVPPPLPSAADLLS